MSKFQRNLKGLHYPYKLSPAYKKYGDLSQESPKRSTFWETSIRYFEKYEHAEFQTTKKQQGED